MTRKKDKLAPVAGNKPAVRKPRVSRKETEGVAKPPRVNSKVVACNNAETPSTVKTERKTDHLFKPGQPSANPSGRPKGSRNKFSENYIEAMLSAFEEHGFAAIEAVVAESPAEFLRLCSAIVPKTFGIDAEVKLDGAEAFLKVWEAISEGRA